MVFRQKKVKSKPNSSGTRKLKRSILFPTEVFHCPSTERTTSVECEVEQSDPVPLVNEEAVSAIEESVSCDNGERRRPVRKCRLSMESGPSVSTAHAKLEVSVGDTSERITVVCGSNVDKDEGNTNSLPCVNADEKYSLCQPFATFETSVTDPKSKKRRRCAKGRRKPPKCPQVVSNAVDNEYNENISPENGAFSDRSAGVSPVEKEKDDGLQGTINVVSSCQTSVSQRLYDSVNLRNLRVMVTRAELPSNIPEKVCTSEKLSAASENDGIDDRAVSLKQKSKNRGKKVNSVESVSSRESMDSLDRILFSDVERDIVDGGKDTDVESCSKETLNGQRKTVSAKDKRRKSLGRVVRRGSDTCEEIQDVKKDALGVINKKTVCNSAERIVGGECLKTSNEEVVHSHLKIKTPLRRTSRIKSSSTDASSSELANADVVDISEASSPAHSRSRLSSPEWTLESNTCKMVDTRKLSVEEFDLFSYSEKCKPESQYGHRKAVSKVAKKKKSLGRVVRKGSNTSEETLDLNEGSKIGTDVRKLTASAKRDTVSGDCLMVVNEKAVSAHLKSRTTLRRTCRIKSSSPDVSDPELTSASLVDTVVVSTSADAKLHSAMERNSPFLSNTCQMVDTRTLSDVESNLFSGSEKCETEIKDGCKKSISIRGKRRKSLGRVIRKESDTSEETLDLNERAKRGTDIRKVSTSAERAVVGVCFTAGNKKVVPAHLKNKTALRRTCRIKSSSPDVSSSELMSADVVDKSVTSTSADTNSHTSSTEGQSLSLPGTCDLFGKQVFSHEESDPVSGNEECAHIGRRLKNMTRYRIKSESDSDENEALLPSKTGCKMRTGKYKNQSSVLGKLKNEGLSNSVSTTCIDAADRGACRTLLTNPVDLDCDDVESVELENVQKIKENSILAATKSTQTSIHSSTVDFKVNGNCEKKSVGVQKDMEMASSVTQTEISLPAAVEEKGLAENRELHSQTNDIQSLMLELLSQLKSSYESQVVGEVAPPCGALLKNSVSRAKKDGLKSGISLQQVHESPGHGKNASIQMPLDEHILRKKEVSSRSKKSVNTVRVQGCTSRSGDKSTTTEKVADVSISNVPSHVSSFMQGLDHEASSSDVSKRKHEKNSSVVPEPMQVISKVIKTNNQLNGNNSKEMSSKNVSRKSIFSSKRRKSSGSESSKISKGENNVEYVTSFGNDNILSAVSDSCILKELQKSTVAVNGTSSNCMSPTSGTSKVSTKETVVGKKDISGKFIENSIRDTDDLKVIWHTKSDKGIGKIAQLEENITKNFPVDKSVEIINVVKKSSSQTGSRDDLGKGRKCTLRPIKTESLVDVTEPYYNVSDVTAVEERTKLREEKGPAVVEMSVLNCIPTHSKPCGKDLEQSTQPSTEDICIVEEEGHPSLDDDADELSLKIVDGDCDFTDDDGDADDCDVISIYGESDYDLLLTGMCNHQQAKSLDVSEVKDNSPTSSKFQCRIPVVKKISVTPNSQSESVAKNRPETYVPGEIDSCVADASVSQKPGLADEDACPVGDLRVTSDEQASRMTVNNISHGDTPVVADPNFVFEDIMETSSSGGDKTSPCKNQGAYHDADMSTRSHVPVSEKKYCLMPPANIWALHVSADSIWRKQGSILKGMCFSFLRRGNCPCKRFNHMYPPNFMHHIDNMNSWDIFVCLVHSLRRNFISFWDKFGVQVMNVLADRHKETYLHGVLFIYCCSKLSSSEWLGVLKSLECCGITDEHSVQQILLYLLINHLHKGKIKNRTAYNELVDKVARISCYFKETKLLCEVLEVLNRNEFWFTKLTFENLLQRCVTEASTHVGLELCFIFGKFVNRLGDLSHAEPSVLVLVKELVEILESSGEIQIVDSIKRKITRNMSSNASMEDYTYSLGAPSQQHGNATSVQLFGGQRMQSDEHGSGLMGVEHVNLKRPNLNMWEDPPSKKPLFSSFPCSGVTPSIDLTHPAFKSCEIRKGGCDHSLPQYELNLPDISTSTLTDDLKPVGLQSPSQCSRSSTASSTCGKKDGVGDDLRANASPAHSLGHLSTTVSRTQKHSVYDHSLKVPSIAPLVVNEVSGENTPGSQLAMDVDKVPPLSSLTITYRELDTEEQSSSNSSSLSGTAIVDPVQVGFSSEEEEEFEKSADLDESYPAPEMMNPNVGSSGRPLTYSEVYKQKYNVPLLPLPNPMNPLAPPKNLTLEEVIKKRQWTPILLLKFFNPCLGSAEQEKNFVIRIVNIMDDDMSAALHVMKAVVNSLESKEFIESINHPKYTLMKKFISTLVFNVMLKMILCDMWNEAYTLMNIANDAALPLMTSEAYMQAYDKMSQSRKILFFSEICFRCEKMNEAIHLLSVGSLFHQIPSQWKYGSCDADFEIRVAFINSLICKLAIGGYSDLAPQIYLEVHRCQNGVSESVDLLIHANKVIICALNGGFCHLAYDVYRTVPDDDPVLPKVTLRALLCGMVSGDIKPLAKPIYHQMSDSGAYPVFKEKHLVTEITIKSFWLKEEICVIFDNALQIWGPILLVDQPTKYKEHGFSVSLLVKYFDVPNDLDVALKIDDEPEKDPVPYYLTLQSNSVQHALEEVVFVLEKMLVPAIKYEVFSEQGSSKRVVLNKISLINHLINVGVKAEGYH